MHCSLAVLFAEWFGSAPYEWQLDVVEAHLLGLDSVVIAGTGSGKKYHFIHASTFLTRWSSSSHH